MSQGSPRIGSLSQGYSGPESFSKCSPEVGKLSEGLQRVRRLLQGLPGGGDGYHKMYKG